MKMDVSKINSLATETLQEAQSNAVALLDTCTFHNIAKKFRLIEDIKKARKSAEVCRIIYYTYLAGEGLSVLYGKGTWQKDFA